MFRYQFHQSGSNIPLTSRIFQYCSHFFQKEPDISLPRPEVRLLSCIFEYFVLLYPCLYDRQAGKTVWGKGIRLAVIKFIATLIIALCTFSTETENTMATQIPTTQTSNTLVSTTADRPSAYLKDIYSIKSFKLICPSTFAAASFSCTILFCLYSLYFFLYS